MYYIRTRLEKWKNTKVYIFAALYHDTNYVLFSVFDCLFGVKMVGSQSSPCLNGAEPLSQHQLDQLSSREEGW